jgi:hypothetical protein
MIAVHPATSNRDRAGWCSGHRTTYYWIVSDPNKQDWDYINIGDRSLHVDVKFDNNMFRTNFLLHPMAGTLSYWIARSNGLDVYASFASSALSSATFEFLLEWLEKPSINDLIVTPFGGVAAGEFFFHLGDYLNSALDGGSTAQRAFAFTVGAPQAIHDAMDGLDVPLATRDSLGYSAAYWHRFSIGYGWADVANDSGDRGSVRDLLFHAKLVAMPGFLRPGRFSVDFHQGNFTEARLRTSFADGLLKDVDLWFGSDLVGYYRQNYGGTADALKGSGAMLAASVDMRCVDRWLCIGATNSPPFISRPIGKVWFGLGNGVMARAGHVSISIRGYHVARVQPARHPIRNGGNQVRPSTPELFLGDRRFGPVDRRRRDGRAELGGYAAYGAYRSIDGLDRYPTPLDVANTDAIIEFGAALTYSPPAALCPSRLNGRVSSTGVRWVRSPCPCAIIASPRPRPSRSKPSPE